jgi:hypothetical protein
MLKDLSIKNFENACIICDYIIAEQIEFDIKPTTKNGKIKSLIYLSNSCNNHEKSFKEITKQDILDHLSTFRKSISEDPANRWIGTYFRQMIFNKCFRWLYNPDEPDTTKREKTRLYERCQKINKKKEVFL